MIAYQLIGFYNIKWVFDAYLSGAVLSALRQNVYFYVSVDLVIVRFKFFEPLSKVFEIQFYFYAI